MLRLQTFKLEIAYSKGIEYIMQIRLAKLISLQPIKMKKSRKTRRMSVTLGHQPKWKPSTWIWQSLDLPIRQVTLSEIKAAEAETDAVLESLETVIKQGCTSLSAWSERNCRFWMVLCWRVKESRYHLVWDNVLLTKHMQVKWVSRAFFGGLT